MKDVSDGAMFTDKTLCVIFPDTGGTVRVERNRYQKGDSFAILPSIPDNLFDCIHSEDTFRLNKDNNYTCNYCGSVHG